MTCKYHLLSHLFYQSRPVCANTPVIWNGRQVIRSYSHLLVFLAGLKLPANTPVLYEEVGGIVEPEKMIQAHVLRAWYYGAHVKTGEKVSLTREPSARQPARPLAFMGSFVDLVLTTPAKSGCLLQLHVCSIFVVRPVRGSAED